MCHTQHADDDNYIILDLNEQISGRTGAVDITVDSNGNSVSMSSVEDMPGRTADEPSRQLSQNNVSNDYCKVSNEKEMEGHKHSRNPEKWEKNIQKFNCQSGLKYINTRGNLVPEKRLLVSTCHCRLKCVSRISHEDRMTIFENCKSMGNRDLQAAFIAGHVVPVPKRLVRSVEQAALQKKQKMLRVEVCKKFFVDTLPVGRKSVELAVKMSVNGIAKTDGHGKKPNNKKADKSVNE